LNFVNRKMWSVLLQSVIQVGSVACLCSSFIGFGNRWCRYF
jgi:hypothetical protein